MSKWGVIRSIYDGCLQVVPVDDSGKVLPPHTLSQHCVCDPQIDPECDEMWVHQDPERGGPNA
jgi:hypothetical protein